MAGLLGWLVPVGLLLVLTSNIIALFLPFLEIGIPFNRTTYSLPHSVQLMWEAKLYWVSILIVSFSIVFPVFKTSALLVIWFSRLNPRFRNRVIRVLEALGKWSMLDIFIVILLMTLSTDQIFFETAPKIGLNFFIFAIVGNMVFSRIVEMIDSRLNEPRDKVRVEEEEERIKLVSTTGWLGWTMPLLLIVSFASICIAVELPFLRINDILLHSNSFSIKQAIEAMWNEGRFILALFLLLFVVVAPLLNLAMVGHAWFTTTTPSSCRRRLDLIRICGEWSMMSVFLLGLGLLMTEGSEMVKTQARSGVIAIAVALATCVLSMRLSRWLMLKRLSRG